MAGSTPSRAAVALACSTKSKVQNRRRRYRSLNRQSKAACAVMRHEPTHAPPRWSRIVPREKPVIVGESNVSRECKTRRDSVLLIPRPGERRRVIGSRTLRARKPARRIINRGAERLADRRNEPGDDERTRKRTRTRDAGQSSSYSSVCDFLFTVVLVKPRNTVR